MGIQLNVRCDGPTCVSVEPFPDQQRSILPGKAPKDWLVIKIDMWRQVHKSAMTRLRATDGDGTRYFCGPRCMTLFSLAWWLGIEYVDRDQILIDIRRLTSDVRLDELPPNTPIHRI